MTEWVWLENETIGAKRRFADEPGVVEFWSAKGWTPTTAPDEGPFVPVPVNVAPGDTTFITLWHPEVGATHQFPNNPEAIAGAREAGWTDIPEPEPVSGEVTAVIEADSSAETESE